MAIKVHNLPPQMTEADLTELFSDYGPIQAVKISASENTASVELAADIEEEDVFKALAGKEWRGNKLEFELVYDDGSRDPDGPP
jgi:RNA recognition motif-containing protein